MRKLFVLRGPAKSGKTFWTKQNQLSPYTISIDELSLMCTSPVLDVNGNRKAPKNPLADSILTQMLHSRMEDGQLTIIDARHAGTDEIRRYKSFLDTYRYRGYIVDFSKCPLEVISDNAYKAFCESDFNYMEEATTALAEFNCTPFETPSRFEIISPFQAQSLIYDKTPYDLSKYSAVNFFGDIHGCYTALMDVMGKIGVEGGELLDDEFYIFCGDYIDRGLENARTLEYLMSIVDRDNVMMLEGNHERWLSDWVKGKDVPSKTFVKKTAPELEASGLDKKALSRFCRRLIPMAFIKDGDGREIFACHGGVPRLSTPFAAFTARELIRGVGDYGQVDEIEALWQSYEEKSKNKIYQVHGHRRAVGGACRPYELVFDLEGGVEFGGEMRVARFARGEEPVAIESTNTFFSHVSQEIPLEELSFDDALDNLRANPMIKEKKLAGGISSFNFTREAFNKAAWDAQSIKARGLFVDPDASRIQARSYDKFFHVGERPGTDAPELAKKMCYPVSVYEKENGYLGIASSLGDGKLFYASKSTTSGDYAAEFKKVLLKQLGGAVSRFSEFLAGIDASAVFEVIAPNFDRHIVEYDCEPHAILLDVIYNDFTFEHLPYDELIEIGREFKLPVKKLDRILNTKTEFLEWYGTVIAKDYTNEKGKQIEGFVLEDSDGYMAKVKTQWYAYWKRIRSIIHDVYKRSHSSKVNDLVREFPEISQFYEWLKRYIYDWRRKHKKDECQEPEVIDVRRAYCEEMGLAEPAAVSDVDIKLSFR